MRLTRSEDRAALLPDARVTRWDGLGHLVHEEVPEKVSAWIADTLKNESLPQTGQAL